MFQSETLTRGAQQGAVNANVLPAGLILGASLLKVYNPAQPALKRDTIQQKVGHKSAIRAVSQRDKLEIAIGVTEIPKPYPE